jgi:M6 family metalloprotease-like protein
MRRLMIVLLFVALLGELTRPVGILAQVSPADPSQGLPEAALRVRAEHPRAFEFERALHVVAERAVAARDGMQATVPGPLARAASTSVAGRFEVPVFAVRFADTPADPWEVDALQERLFGEGDATLTAYYAEVSGGRVEVRGDVVGWTALTGTSTYYAGNSNGLDPKNAKIGELIRDALLAHDGEIDFGLFDNDGPDGIPNSGDDDGYVDFVAFVHPEFGGECGGGNDNIWSHRWRYSSWPTAEGMPFVTGDDSANGGKILINDYVIQPGLSCGGEEMIEIGVFCHEFGHAFGLPDLYDINGGGGAGLGHWCLMASGNWNAPHSPAHMGAWTKRELGWVETLDVSWQGTTIDVAPVAQSGQIHRLGFRDDRWRRRTDCAIGGGTSMVVGLTQAQSDARGWPASRGYGNGWTETIARDFRYGGSGDVSLQYSYAIDTEGGFDFCFVVLEVDGVEHTLAVYDGQRSGTATHDLTTELAGSTQYRVKFRFRSDTAWSNEDGRFVSACAPFVIDDVRVIGGGEDHLADFEEHVGGWYQPDGETDNPVSEYWLVENRQQFGFDQNLHGTGLVVLHVDQEVIATALGNSGGSNDLATRGVVLEEADGLGQLLAKTGGNRGDSGDTWPGSSGATVFDPDSWPAAKSNEGANTTVAIREIETLGDVVRAVFVAGDPAPTAAGTDLTQAPADTTAFAFSLLGASHLRPDVQVRLVRSGQAPLEAESVVWTDHDRVLARFTSGASAGVYDLVVENPDGQTAVVETAFVFTGTVTDVPGAAASPARLVLEQNHPNPFNPRTTLRFALPQDGEVEIAVFDARGRRIVTLHQGALPAGHHEVQWHGTDDQGRDVSSGLYFARMSAGDFQQTRKMSLVR